MATNQAVGLDLGGRSVWVVGAGGGGIGTSVCAELGAAGARVIALDRDEAALQPTRDALHSIGAELHVHVLDAGDRVSMEDFCQKEREAARRPFGLVNIVGGLQRDQFGAILDTDDATFDAIMQRNLRASWLASQLFAREIIAADASLADSPEPATSATSATSSGSATSSLSSAPTAPTERGGSVVQLASIVALEGMPFGATYAAAKAALLSFARTQALEWGPHGIRVNAIAAGTIHTPRSPSRDLERDRRTIPLGRRGGAEDIARAALFFLSDCASWITGQTLAVDGGASIKPSYLDDVGLPVFVDDPILRDRLS